MGEENGTSRIEGGLDGPEAQWGEIEDARFDSENKSWAEQVEDAVEGGWTSGEISPSTSTNGNDWQAIAASKGSAGDEASLRPWLNGSSTSNAKTRGKGRKSKKADPKLAEYRAILRTLPPAKPIPKTGIRLGWSDDEDEPQAAYLPLSEQMGWEDPVAEDQPVAGPSSSPQSGRSSRSVSPESMRMSRSASATASSNGPAAGAASASSEASSSTWDTPVNSANKLQLNDDWSLPSAIAPNGAASTPQKQKSLPEKLWAPTPGSAADLKQKKREKQGLPPLPARDPSRSPEDKGPWRQDGETGTDRFGNDIVEEESWDKKPSWQVKSTDMGWGKPDRPETGWGDALAPTEPEPEADGDYDYLEVEEVHINLIGLKVASEPAKTLNLLHLKHLELRQLDWDDVTEDDLEWLAESALPTNDQQEKDEQAGVLGVSIDMGGEEERGKPPAFCLSSVERALLIRFPEKPLGPKASDMLATVLHSQRLVKAGFRLYETVQLLHYHYNLHFARGYDLGETYTKVGLEFVLDTAYGISVVRECWYEEGHLLALDAWSTCLVAHAAALTEAFKPEMPHINTFEVAAEQLRSVATGAAVAACLASMEQREHKGYIESAKMVKNSYVLTQGRYSTRARRDDRVTLLLDDGAEWSCKIFEADGREITVRPVRANAPALNVASVEDTPCIVKISPHEPPQETARREFARSLLLGGVDLEESRILRTLFLSVEEKESEEPLPLAASPKIEARLNDAQGEAIKKIFNSSPAVLVHGPPGSGKTTVIAHAAKAFLLSDPDPNATMLIVANSNAAIKQCAEALLKHRISPFRLVTSAEYYVGWHAHHYSTTLQRKLVKSDELRYNTPLEELYKLFSGVRIILCTLATLATRKLDNLLLFGDRHVPLIVADEASQIVWSTFLPAIWKIRRGLRKAVFVGDSHQLPPFGATQNAALVRSVFEIEPRPPALEEVLLDTCYRMPVPLGEFVSDLVYKGTLISKHELNAWSCVRFIDVENGRETRVGVSWSNPQESIACKFLVERYYSGSSFCIITPYDAQRDLIERELKMAGLPFDGRVQSIDAAQGSEYDFIIVSLVRTSRAMGFLSDVRRMNVMLTRQRRGLCIVGHPRFVENAAAGSLVGQLAHYASSRVAWSEKLHIPLRDVLANIASVPIGGS